MKKVIVTGASGHIGFHVASQLLQLKYDVTLLIRKENENILQLKRNGATIVVCNLFEPSTYKTAIENADVLFHIASENTTDTSDEARVIENTFNLSKTVLDATVAGNIKTI